MTPWPNYEVYYYEDPKRRCPIEDFLQSLPIKVRAKAEKWIQLLEEEGPNLPRPYADVLRDKIRELRLRFGSNQYRFLYFFCGKTVVLTHGFIKKTEQVPEGEIERAIRLMNDFLIRYGKGEIKL
jgi:phage-related protein